MMAADYSRFLSKHVQILHMLDTKKSDFDRIAAIVLKNGSRELATTVLNEWKTARLQPIPKKIPNHL